MVSNVNTSNILFKIVQLLLVSSYSVFIEVNKNQLLSNLAKKD